MDRSDALGKYHFKFCQSNLPKGDRGFLKYGELPETNQEDFKVLLRLIGIEEDKIKAAKN